LFQLNPYVASAAMRFDQAILQIPKYSKRKSEAYHALKIIPRISFRPDPHKVNMFHLNINGGVEKLNDAI